MTRRPVKRDVGTLDLFALNPETVQTPPVAKLDGALPPPSNKFRGLPLFAGIIFERGDVVCRKHRDQWPWPKGAGWRMTLFSNTLGDANLGMCIVCGDQVVAEDPRGREKGRMRI